MKQLRITLYSSVLLLLASSFTGCVKKMGDSTLPDTVATSTTVTTTNQTERAYNYPVTLPVLDAFFADSSFANDVKSKVGLSDSEVARVRLLAHERTTELGPEGQYTDESGAAARARQEAVQQLTATLGPDKANKLIQYVQTRWATNAGADSTGGGMTGSAMNAKPNAIPQDARIVVNVPEYRMDVFDSGKLLRSYKVAIGYPEFPLPIGLRHASKIIFNPSWTTPDEPWVANSNKVKVGQTLHPGSKLDPLGIMKVPIGLPNLIHGGKSQSQIGNFGSHGCVGLTDAQAKDFVKLLAKLAGDSLTDKQIAEETKNKKQSKEMTLAHTVPVELRYETIMLENGDLHIYRDVYDHGSNTDTAVNAVLAVYGTSLNQLSSDEQQRIHQAIDSMATTATGQPATGGGTADSALNSGIRARSGMTGRNQANADSSVHITHKVQGAKEIVVPIRELAGKGYPAMSENSFAASKEKAK